MEVIITNGPQTLISVSGRLDNITAHEFENAIAPILAGNMEDIVLDCAALGFISSAGLRLFLTLQKAAQAKHGKLRLKNVQSDIKEIFYMTGFSKLFSFE